MKTFLLIITGLITLCVNSYGQNTNTNNEPREVTFDTIDIQILLRADKILIDETYWSKADDRKCLDDIDANKYSLFCALYKASIDIVGEYNHRKPGLQQLRWIITDKYRHRYDDHRLMNFNNHPDTTFEEIKNLIAESLDIIKKKIKEAQGRS